MIAAQYRQSPTARLKQHYIGCCLMCEEEKIRAMIDRRREISYKTARHAIGPTVLDAWSASMGYFGDHAGGAALQDDPSVTYYRSRYDVLSCVYIVHKQIRHIFI